MRGQNRYIFSNENCSPSHILNEISWALGKIKEVIFYFKMNGLLLPFLKKENLLLMIMIVIINKTIQSI